MVGQLRSSAPCHIGGMADAAAVRTPSYTKSLRPASGEYEIDHLISLELGGSNDIENLSPESYSTELWNAHVKGKLEDRLHELVCSGRMRLEDALPPFASLCAPCEIAEPHPCPGE